MSDTVKPVVVGVDESPASRGALWWAVREAQFRRLPLLIAHAMSGLDFDRAAEVADDALHQARHLAPGLSVNAVVDEQRPAGRALCHLSEDAALVVVASRGLGGFTGLLLGSVSAHVAAYAACPVLVVRNARQWGGPTPGATLPVVVGIGPRTVRAPGTDPLVGLAFAEARMRGAHLVSVRAWRPPAGAWESGGVAALETAERLDLAETLQPWRHTFPDVTVRQRIVPSGAAAALVAAGSEAQLVVVGAHRARTAGLRLGSIGQQVLHHAPCPVAVVHVITSTDPDPDRP